MLQSSSILKQIYIVRNVIRFAENKSSVYLAGGKQSGLGFLGTLAEGGQFGILQFLEVANYFQGVAKPKLSWTFLLWIFGESSSMLSAYPSIGWLEFWGLWNPLRSKVPSGEARRLKRLSPLLALACGSSLRFFREAFYYARISTRVIPQDLWFFGDTPNGCFHLLKFWWKHEVNRHYCMNLDFWCCGRCWSKWFVAWQKVFLWLLLANKVTGVF